MNILVIFTYSFDVCKLFEFSEWLYCALNYTSQVLIVVTGANSERE
jgi:hypothetical protein